MILPARLPSLPPALLPVFFLIVVLAASATPSGAQVPPRQEHVTYLPLLLKPPPLGLYGYVTERGLPAPGLLLELRFFDGTFWETAATTFTDEYGRYTFAGLAPLMYDELYYVRYVNDSDPSRLSYWATERIMFYLGGDLNIGNFDVADIELLAPSSGAIVALPQTFRWTRRAASPVDEYAFVLFDPDDGVPMFRSEPLGYSDSYTLGSLPPGFQLLTSYSWTVHVYESSAGQSGAFGYAYSARDVRFTDPAVVPGP